MWYYPFEPFKERGPAMTTLSEMVQAFPHPYLFTLEPLGEYSEAANEGWIPQTRWVEEFLPSSPKPEEGSE